MTNDHKSPKTFTTQKSFNSSTSTLTHPWPKRLLLLLITLITTLLFFQIQSLHNPFTITSSSITWSLYNTYSSFATLSNPSTASLDDRLRDSVTFLPLKDLRFAKTAMEGNTWFMSSINDTREPGESQHLRFPSAASHGRLLCMIARDKSDGAKNHYALAWPDALPIGASVRKGLTFVSDTYYDYDNIWHGLSAVVPFVRWHARNLCAKPARWVLFHWGEARSSMGPWHNEGSMSVPNRRAVYDMMRCRARSYCNINERKADSPSSLNVTLFLRTGARAFANESGVIGVFERECGKVEGCAVRVRRPNGLSFCEQVRLMGETDVLVSSHGAQLTNMFFMERNSSVMEFFPKGWLEMAGVGQYVYHWIAGWSGMRHEGAWRDPNGVECPKEMVREPGKCFTFYKDQKIGFDEEHFGRWAERVLKRAKQYKLDRKEGRVVEEGVAGCSCGS
ncbi:hypothetical protein QJS10_CPB12g01444 [Acorus calamus]|uniref:Glycosyltransferase 61 catalytic domain-containing protein n=1 Tax=Acorus calamus TaxID=4465 RepID=A0AAV9DPF2_ACOCL|nr:hypothetical protein QJS10_CPB12g01444 [Acorus calamus]